jgi:hypothetical protein
MIIPPTQAPMLATTAAQVTYPDSWNALNGNTRNELVNYYSSINVLSDINDSIEDHVSWLHERINNWIGPIVYWLWEKDRESDAEIRDILKYTVDIIHWQTREYNRGTELGKIFWTELSPEAKKCLPELGAIAKRELNINLHVPEGLIWFWD